MTMQEQAAMTREEFTDWIAAHDYTMDGLARALGINRTSLYKWTSGRHPVTPIMKLALEQLEYQKKRGVDGPDPYHETLPEEFEAWMTEHYYTDGMLAEILSVHPISVARWRSGKHPVAFPLRLAMERLNRLPASAEAARKRAIEAQRTERKTAGAIAEQRIATARDRAVRSSRR